MSLHAPHPRSTFGVSRAILAGVNAEELLLCSQPLASTTDVAGFELFQFGTCFIVKFRARHWVIAATHSLVQHGGRDDRLPDPPR